MAFASEAAAVVRWISAAGRYAAADYALHMLQRPLDWMRDEVAPNRGVRIDDVAQWVDALHACSTVHRSVLEHRDDALKEFERACVPLARERLLSPTGVVWQDARLVPQGLSSPHSVSVPATASAPWPLVKVYRSTVEHFADVSVPPEPTRPTVRRTAYGFERVDHTGQRRRLQPTDDDRYLLHGFAWRGPADPDAT